MESLGISCSSRASAKSGRAAELIVDRFNAFKSLIRLAVSVEHFFNFAITLLHQEQLSQSPNLQWIGRAQSQHFSQIDDCFVWFGFQDVDFGQQFRPLVPIGPKVFHRSQHVACTLQILLVGLAQFDGGLFAGVLVTLVLANSW